MLINDAKVHKNAHISNRCPLQAIKNKRSTFSMIQEKSLPL
jgi:hypothetical protein